MAELREDNVLKTKQIADLQTQYGHLAANFLELQKKLEDKFGDEFKSNVEEPYVDPPIPDAPSVDAPTTSQPIRSPIIVDRFEVDPELASRAAKAKGA